MTTNNTNANKDVDNFYSNLSDMTKASFSYLYKNMTAVTKLCIDNIYTIYNRLRLNFDTTILLNRCKRCKNNNIKINKQAPVIDQDKDDNDIVSSENYRKIDHKFGYVETPKNIRKYKNIDHNDTIVPLWETINQSFENSIHSSSQEINTEVIYLDKLYQHQVNIALCAAIIQLSKQLNKQKI